MCEADLKERRADAFTGTEAQRNLDMLNRNIGLAHPIPEDAASVPPAREAGVEDQGTIHPRRHRVDVLTRKDEHLTGIHQYSRVVASQFQGSPCEIGALPSVPLRIFAAAVKK